MKGLKKARRVQILALAFIALAGSTALIGYAMRDGINFYRDPSRIVAEPPEPGEVFRLGGLVEEGSLVRGQGETVTFRVTDGAETVDVAFTGVLPDLFKEGQGMIGTGEMVGGVFRATEILAKHDETYMPKEVMDSLKATGAYVDPDAPDAKGHGALLKPGQDS